jgi:transcriptional regulator with XRE-family HTH domain
MQAEKVTGHQIRAARGALNWSVKRLADETGVSTATIVRYEQYLGVPNFRKDSITVIQTVLESAGIEFIGTPDDAPGIRIHARRSKT